MPCAPRESSSTEKASHEPHASRVLRSMAFQEKWAMFIVTKENVKDDAALTEIN